MADIRPLASGARAYPCGPWCNRHYCQDCGEPVFDPADDGDCTDGPTDNFCLRCAKRRWALRSAYSQADIDLINRVYPPRKLTYLA